MNSPCLLLHAVFSAVMTDRRVTKYISVYFISEDEAVDVDRFMPVVKQFTWSYSKSQTGNVGMKSGRVEVN